MKKIILAQYWTNNINYGEYTKSINERYCNLKNYTYHLENDDDKIKSRINDRAITWYKPLLILDVFEKYNPDYVLFLDADAIVSDDSYNIEDFIDDNYDIICTEDHGPSKINAGVFLLKNTAWTKNFLTIWFASAELFKGGLDMTQGYYKNALWHDQTVFGLLMDNNKDFSTHIKIIDNSILNNREYKNNGVKNFIFHAFAYGNLQYRNIDLAYYDIFNIKKEMNDIELTEMSKLYYTDKHYEHNYFELIYTEAFTPIRYNVKKMVEIGILNGESTKLWRDYFVNAEIIGVDINLNGIKEITNRDRLTFLEKDMSNIDNLNEFCLNYNDIDIIIDDASHKMLDQQLTFAKLFRNLKSGGIYVIEDLHTSLEVHNPDKRIFGWGDPEKTTTLEMLKNFQNTNNIISDYISNEDIEYLNNNIKSVEIKQSRPDWSITSIIIKK
jgi:hypothetical protein